MFTFTFNGIEHCTILSQVIYFSSKKIELKNGEPAFEVVLVNEKAVNIPFKCYNQFKQAMIDQARNIVVEAQNE